MSDSNTRAACKLYSKLVGISQQDVDMALKSLQELFKQRQLAGGREGMSEDEAMYSGRFLVTIGEERRLAPTFCDDDWAKTVTVPCPIKHFKLYNEEPKNE